MRTLESRLNELEKTLNADNEQGLPCFMYISHQGDDKQTERQAELKAYEEYKARNIKDYPQLETMTLDDLYDSFKGRKDNPVIHIMIVDCTKKAGDV